MKTPYLVRRPPSEYNRTKCCFAQHIMASKFRNKIVIYYRILKLKFIILQAVGPLLMEREVREMERLPTLRDWRTSGMMYVKRIYTLLRLPLIRWAISTTFANLFVLPQLDLGSKSRRVLIIFIFLNLLVVLFYE